MATALTDAERRELLEELAQIGTDADTNASALRVFLPLAQHGRALDPQVMLIRGERGAGKTALFHVLRELDEQNIRFAEVIPRAPDIDVAWIEGFSETSTAHPSPNTLVLFAREHDDIALRLMWYVHLVGVVAATLKVPPPVVPALDAWTRHRTDPAAWATLASSDMGKLESWLDAQDARLAAEKRFAFVSYDHLDKVGATDRTSRERLVNALLALWLTLSNRYRALRAKMFIREDLFEQGLRSSPDASKLKARSVSLAWSSEQLYRALIRHMANHSVWLCEWLFDCAHVPMTDHALLGWLPPAAMPEEADLDPATYTQRDFAKALAGETMGEGVKKGYVHRWITNHIQDAHTAVLPRSMLRLLANAAEQAVQRGPRGVLNRLFRPEELQSGLEQTSRDRVSELAEEYPVVQRLEHLTGLVVMASRDEVEQRLAVERPSPDGFGDNGEAVLDELLRLGVMKLREDGRIDVPDLYRFAYGIKRKGGVARPR